MAGRNPLARLKDLGQSVWCDDIGREFLLAGKLKALIDEDGVSGLTSNPSIFHKAIAGSTAYDGEIAALASAGAGPAEIMETLMVDDIATAADQLHPVHVDAGTRDGWVSLEVVPTLAYDTQGTVTEALRLRALVDRPNVMIKVPATREGVAAVQDLTARGCSVNVTLIFSLERYREVMEAYLSGLETLQCRRAGGEDVPAPGEVHGVASFFVSRLDTLVDRRLDVLAAGDGTPAPRTSEITTLRGKAAVANAKLAYALFRQTFAGPRWTALSGKGATFQRPLWASTSTKDPAYSDILYVQELIGPDTVNTMPLQTMAAFRDHGRPAETITEGVDEARAHLERLVEVGIDLDSATAQLEREGVRAFVDAFEGLMATLEEKRARLTT